MLLSTPGGRKIGIEVTELIDEKAMRAFARQKSASSIRDDFGGGPPWVDWSVEKITNGVLKAIAAKDQKLAKVAGDYNELFVAIVTDESGVYEEIARKAASLCNTAVSVVTRAFLILSYHPQADTNLYPDGCVVLPIKLVPRAELGRLGQ